MADEKGLEVENTVSEGAADFEVEFAKMKDELAIYKAKYEVFEKAAKGENPFASKKDKKKMADAEIEVEEEEEEEEEMMKALPAPVRQMISKAREAEVSARVELRKEVEARKDREFVAKASAWGNLSIDPSEIGPALRKMAEFDANLADNVIGALASANAQAEAANIFAELGTPARPDSGDAYGRMTKMAKAAVDAGEYKTIEQAISGLVQTNPDLYTAYRQESSK